MTMPWSGSKAESRAVAPLVAAVTALLVMAGAVVVFRSTDRTSASAFISGGRTPTPAASPLLGAATVRRGPLSGPTAIDAALAAAGTPVPSGAHVYAAKIGKDSVGPTYDAYVAGGGALATDFWPASSIKVLAALGALEFVGTMGYTGAATVSFGDTGETSTLKAVYDAAIRVSSNPDYDRLVQIAGVDWLNRDFLTPARGFPATVIQRSYTAGGLLDSPALTLTEGTRRSVLPARTSSVVTECPAGNCSDLFEMSESVRRIVMNDEIPPAERFRIAASDVAGLTGALRGADGFFTPAVAQVVGAGARIYSKPGEVPGRDCLDVTLIETRTGKRFLLSATVPDDQGDCDTLVKLAAAVLRVLTSL